MDAWGARRRRDFDAAGPMGSDRRVVARGFSPDAVACHTKSAAVQACGGNWMVRGNCGLK